MCAGLFVCCLCKLSLTQPLVLLSHCWSEHQCDRETQHHSTVPAGRVCFHLCVGCLVFVFKKEMKATCGQGFSGKFVFVLFFVSNSVKTNHLPTSHS